MKTASGVGLIAERYQLGARLGRGGQGEVFQARDRLSGGACVIKFGLVGPGQAALVAEFRNLVGLSHRNVARVLDVGRVPAASGTPPALVGRPFLVLAGAPGQRLDERENPSAAVFMRVARALCEALAFLHARGVVHGDLSPGNVVIDLEGEPVIVDFGLSGGSDWYDGRAGPQAFSGTAGFSAPEALWGERGMRGDLFALGATLFAWWTGQPPFGLGADAVKTLVRVLGEKTGGAPALSSLRVGLGPAWDVLLARLLAPDPAHRPVHARAVLTEILRTDPGAEVRQAIAAALDQAPFPAGDPLAGLFVGRAAERARVGDVLRVVAVGDDAPPVLTLSGPPGSGRTTLLRQALADRRAASVLDDQETIEVSWPSEADLGRELSIGASAGLGDPERHAARARRDWLRRQGEIAARSPRVVVLPETPEPGDVRALAQLCAAARVPGLLVVLRDTQPLAAVGGLDVELPPVTDEDVSGLFAASGEPDPGPDHRAALRTASGGNVAMLAALVRSTIEAVRLGKLPRPDRDLLSAPDLASTLDRGFAALPEGARQFLVLSLFGGSQAAEGAQESLPTGGAEVARAAGWVSEGAARPVRQAAILRGAATMNLDPALRTALHAAVLARPDDDELRGEGMLLLGQPDLAVAALRAAGRTAFARGAWARGVACLVRAHAVSGSETAADVFLLVRGWGLLGQYGLARETLARVRPENARDRLERVELSAWIERRAGNPAAAEAALTREIAALGGAREDAVGGALLHARLARLLIGQGSYQRALSFADRAVATLARGSARNSAGSDTDDLYAPERVRAEAWEAVALAHAYLGDFPAAERAIDNLAHAPGPPGGRVAALRGLLAQLRGAMVPAAACFEAAAAAFEATDDPHGVAAASLNLGLVLAEQGLTARALPSFQRALDEFTQLGVMTDRCLTLFNTALLLIGVGDREAAGRALGQLRELAPDPRGRALYAFGEGERLRVTGDAAGAIVLLAEARAGFAAGGDPRMAVESGAAQVHACLAAGRIEEARAVLADWRTESAADPESQWFARARSWLAAVPDGENPPSALPALRAIADAAVANGRRPAALRATILLARIQARQRSPDAHDSVRKARALFEEIKMSTAPHHRDGLAIDPDIAWMISASTPSAVAPGDAAAWAPLAQRLADTEGRLQRFVRISRRLNSESRLPRLLETIMDTVLELTQGERGFVLLREGTEGELRVKAARNIDLVTLAGTELEFSRSIAQRVAETGEALITVDASGDERFRQALSVSHLRLRSVAAVPLNVQGNTVGTIYVDNRLRKGAFNDDDVKVLIDFAEQAALAIENARLLGELRRRERRIETLNQRLAHDLDVRKEELSSLRIEIAENRDALAVRYDYRHLVGRSPRMLELFRILDRVTDSSLPVLVLGESGTGKELVARALHANGPRKAQAFVSENCAAIPETLLESTLFGHVKGAFTGADRDNRGLFAIADGGTLFLDEVAEMSPALQGKLLRVLQDGEVRRLGSERGVKTDVRVIAATNRDLERLVDEGKFRQDLFFRLAVIQVALPPLRERREDIPLLARHFLQRIARPATATAGAAEDPGKDIDADALARLCSYRWPGNVRELENELHRASVFSGARITVADLSPGIAREDGVVLAAGADDLSLRPRVERLERSLIREALERNAGNQTRAAEVLGLSRFGLQKKLKRYGVAT